MIGSVVNPAISISYLKAKAGNQRGMASVIDQYNFDRVRLGKDDTIILLDAPRLHLENKEFPAFVGDQHAEIKRVQYGNHGIIFKIYRYNHEDQGKYCAVKYKQTARKTQLPRDAIKIVEREAQIL